MDSLQVQPIEILNSYQVPSNEVNNNLLFNQINNLIILTSDIKCPLCRNNQDVTFKSIIYPDKILCPICLDEKQLFIPCTYSTSHILSCTGCYISLLSK